ncbi:menaquinone biosynthesis protein [Candidatus Desantisbacteria bacterium]|nr:menaquinone biosynthesis protein [Candidatus Desantisbacteria bacterium]
MRPRIGHIQYLNCLPLYYGLINNKALFHVDLVKGTPTELNRLFLDNKLDVSPISAIEYCLNAGRLMLLPDLTVSSDGEVKSILLICREPLKKLNGKKIALTTNSATSRILTKIIVKEKYNLDVKYIDAKPSLTEALKEAEAVLLIGDEALKILYNPEGLLLYDLGREWKELTGKKMVYAVWAVHREFAKTKPEVLQKIYSNFISSMLYSSKKLNKIAKECAKWEIFDAEFLFDYFKSLHFEFGAAYQEGMKLFFEKAGKHGFIKKVPELVFAEVKRDD